MSNIKPPELSRGNARIGHDRKKVKVTQGHRSASARESIVDSIQVLLVGLGFFIAGVVKGATGLGYSTSALPILTLAVGLHTAMPLVLFPSLASNLTVMVGAGHFRATLRRFRWLYL